MNAILRSTLAVALLLTSMGSVGAPTASPDVALFGSLTKTWTAAVVARDRAKMDGLLAPDFTFRTWDDAYVIGRDHYLTLLLTSYRLSDYTETPILANVYGDVATVRSFFHLRGTMNGSPIDQHGVELVVWKRIAGRWQVVLRGVSTDT